MSRNASPDSPSSSDNPRERLNLEHAALVREIDSIASAVDAEYAFQFFLAMHVVHGAFAQLDPGHESNPSLVELAAHCLYPHFSKSRSRDRKQIWALYGLIEKIDGLRGMMAAFNAEEEARENADIAVHMRLNAEYVRGHAYADQTKHQIANLQAPFDSWFQRRLGIAPTRALLIVEAVADLLSEKVQHVLGVRLNREQPSDAVIRELVEDVAADCAASFSEMQGRIQGLQEAEWSSLRVLIGLTASTRATMDSHSDVQFTPLYCLSDGRITLDNLSSINDALFSSFDQVARSDDGFRDRYAHHLAAWMEREVINYVTRVFPKDSVYHSLTYPDPDHAGGEAELDVAVKWGPILIVLEVKGGQLRPSSRMGDLHRLRQDLDKNIEHAFDQARRVIRYIDSDKLPVLRERSTSRTLSIDKNRLSRILPISVTLHHFAGLTTHLAALRKIGLFKDQAYPWSVSLADLDVITRFIGIPEAFMHYVKRRLDIEHLSKRITGDELELFGCYLDIRLHPTHLWEQPSANGETEFDNLWIAWTGDRFNQWYQVEQGGPGEKPEIELKIPDTVSRILDELRRRGDDGAIWAAFSLLDLPNSALEDIDRAFRDLRKKVLPHGKMAWITFKNSGTAFVIIAHNGMEEQAFAKGLAFHTGVIKYRERENQAVGLGINLKDPTRAVDAVCWLEGPWEPDPEMERAVAKLPTSTNASPDPAGEM